MNFVKAYIGETPLFEASSAGAEILKTGQTTSYATGDDGDIEAGRPTDFFTLASSNPFGNLDRFTALDGTQTYTNNIVIDWSTYDGATVLGFFIGDTGVNRSWEGSLTWANSLAVAGFSGWRLPNIKEYLNLVIFEYSETERFMRYPPFYSVPNANFWSSTTSYMNSTVAFRIQSALGSYSGTTKTTLSRTIACRNFTVTGTTLT